MKPRLLFILSVGLLLAADDSRKDPQNMQGVWSVVTGERDGKTLGQDEIKNRKVHILGTRYAVKDGDSLIDQGTIKLDPAKSPKTIDIICKAGPYAGKTLLGIYELDGDARKVCFALPGKPRPTEFTTKPESGWVSITYSRDKAGK